AEEAQARAEERLATHNPDIPPARNAVHSLEEIGSAWQASASSFCFFASGAIIPVLPYLFGLTGWAAVALAAGLVGAALMVPGGLVGVLSGAPLLRGALRRLAIGWGAAAATYLRGLAFGTSLTCRRSRPAAEGARRPRR